MLWVGPKLGPVKGQCLDFIAFKRNTFCSFYIIANTMCSVSTKTDRHTTENNLLFLSL